MEKWWKTYERFVIVIIVLACGLGVACFVKAGLAPPPKAKQVTATVETFDLDKFADVMNGYRMSNGVHGLQRDPVLDAAARMHAVDMQKRGYYSHTSPDGLTAYTRVENAVGHSTYSGENQDSICSTVTVGQELSRFSESAEHDGNMLDPKFNTFGVGYVASDNDKCNGYLVIDFAEL